MKRSNGIRLLVCLAPLAFGSACVHDEWDPVDNLVNRCPGLEKLADSVPTDGALSSKHLQNAFSFSEKNKNCDEGIYSSQLADIVTRAATDDTADVLSAMDGNKGLAEFALRHIDASADISDLEKGRANIRAACLKKKYRNCDALENEFNQAIRVGTEP